MNKQQVISVRIYERELRTGKTSFYLDYSTPTISRKRVSLNLISTGGKRSEDYRRCKAIAEEIKQRKIQELRQRVYSVSDQEQLEVYLTVYFQDYLNNYNKADNRRVKAVYQLVKQFFPSNLYLQDINEADCEDFAKMLSKRLKKETASNYFSAFKRALKRARLQKLIPFNPAEGVTIKAPKDKLVKQVLTKSELKELEATDCGNEGLKRAFLLCTQTGLGYRDVKALRWEQIRSEEDRIYLAYARSKTQVATEIKLNTPALRFIQYSGQKEGLVFSKLPTNEGANKTIQTWVQRAEIDKHITFYCARHTFGTLQAEAGVNLQVIAKNMGQTSTQHTVQYINHVDAAKESAVDRIGDW